MTDVRPLIEKALGYCSQVKNPITGYLHSSQQKEGSEGVVPLLDNWFFALALFKSREMERCQEGKELLGKLLALLNENGVSPAYLHDYPHCHDRYIGLEMLPIIYTLITREKQAVGSQLEERLINAAKALITHYLDAGMQQRMGYPLLLLLACSLQAFGALLNDSKWGDEGERLLAYLHQYGEVESWLIPTQLSQILTALLMGYKELNSSPWKALVQRAIGRWDLELQTFSAPAVEEFYLSGAPEVTPFDAAIAAHLSLSCKRTEKPSGSHLRALLLTPFPALQQEEVEASSGAVGKRSWIMRKKGSARISLIEQGATLTSTWKGRMPFKLLWGSADLLYSLVLQLPYWTAATFSECEGGCLLNMQMEEAVDPDEKERELAFYLSPQEGTQVLISGKPATTFTLNDVVEVVSEKLSCRLTFRVVEGEGSFLGHIMHGTRPAERGEKKGYDRQIFLRTIKRSPSCQVQVKVEIM